MASSTTFIRVRFIEAMLSAIPVYSDETTGHATKLANDTSQIAGYVAK